MRANGARTHVECGSQVPYFNAPIYLENKSDVGKVRGGASRARRRAAHSCARARP